jgi:hypothetical protein
MAGQRAGARERDQGRARLTRRHGYSHLHAAQRVGTRTRLSVPCTENCPDCGSGAMLLDDLPAILLLNAEPHFLTLDEAVELARVSGPYVTRLRSSSMIRLPARSTVRILPTTSSGGKTRLPPRAQRGAAEAQEATGEGQAPLADDAWWGPPINTVRVLSTGRPCFHHSHAPLRAA